MSDDLHIPIVQEEARITKRPVAIEQVNVRTFAEAEHMVVRDTVSEESVEVTRVSVDQEVTTAPPVRTEGDLTIIPVMEERLVVEKRLFVVEELHLRRTTARREVAIPVTVRHTRVAIERDHLQHEPG